MIENRKDDNYSITVERSFEHANAHMIYFMADDADFEEWKGASIDPKPLKLYDINGKKLFYQFSVYKNNALVGKIKVCADKTLGQSVQSFEFNPNPFDANEAIKKSKEIAKSEYPNGKIKSTKIVVYNYPDIGVMTIVKDKTTGDEHRIFVDVYTLEVVPNKPATEIESGVWSIYEKVSKNKIDENLKTWNESDQLTKSIEQEAARMGINISAPITEENKAKLISDGAEKSTTLDDLTLEVLLYGQENDHYCAPASAEMIAKFYNVQSSQDYIYTYMGGTGGYIDNNQQLKYYKNGLGKLGSVFQQGNLTFETASNEIDNLRPFKSAITNHARVCRGYISNGSIKYLKINDPWPVGKGKNSIEALGLEVNRIYVRD